MRIGIDGGCLPNRRGFGRFAREVVRALSVAGSSHEFAVLVDRPSLDRVEIPARMETIAVEVREAPSRAASAGGRRGVRDLLAMGRGASKSGLDLIYFPASYSFFPVWNCGKVVVTMHDTLALAHPELVFSSWKGRLAWAVKEHAAVRWADRVMTVSQAAKADLAAIFKLDPASVGVVPEAADEAFRPMSDGPDSRIVLERYRINPSRRFLLYVGGLSPHKNLPRLIEAFAAGAPPDADLVLVGDLKDVFLTHVPALRDAVGRLGLDGRVNFTGFVPDAGLAYVYSRAFALVQPSLMEGFGLPPVEAMACGTPVLSSRAGSLPEVVGEAGEFFDPLDVPGMADAIRSLFADPDRRDRLATSALARSRTFTWKAAADALLSCFDSLLEPVQKSPGRAA
jgi:glycosyltransferase involved in cell wall biosynthesis